MKDKERYYVFEWYEKNKRNKIVRHSAVRLSKFIGDTATDSKLALQIFMAQNGGLNKIEIIKIKEFNENGQIGEDITPSENTNIVPSGR